MKRLTIIDLDSIVYILAYRNKEERLETLVAEEVRKYVHTILTKTEAECFTGFYQVEGHKNYRNEVFPAYKSNRPPTPDFIKQWRPIIHSVFKEYKSFVGLTVIESDDALSILHERYKASYYITLADVDKDLKCIPCRHYNYKSGVTVSIGKEEAEEFAKVQVLMGDGGDGIPGIKGCGKVMANKYVKEYGKLCVAYKEASKKKADGSWIHNLYRDYSCIHLLKDIDELKKYTTREEVNIFKIDCMEVEEYIEEDFSFL